MATCMPPYNVRDSENWVDYTNHFTLLAVKGQTKQLQCCKSNRSKAGPSWWCWELSVWLYLPSSSSSAAGGSNGAGAPQTSSLKSKGLGLLGKLKMSAELLIALAALLSWVVVGVVMFDFVEYKAVPGRSQIPKKITFFFLELVISIIRYNLSICLFLLSDIQQIITDPVQAVNDAVDEVSSLLNKFQGI